MRLILNVPLALGIFMASGTRAEEPSRKAVERAIVFLEADAAKWRKEKTCSTCHHGTMTTWALTEAKNAGYKPEKLTEIAAWTKERLKDIDKPRDPRDGWKMVNSIGVYLSAMTQAVPSQEVLTPDDLKRIAGHLVRHQEANGSWAWSLAPAKNRPPPFFESDELVTMLADMALRPHVPADPKAKSEIRDAKEKGVAWFAKAKPEETTQFLTFRLFRDLRAGRSPEEIRAEIDKLFALQRKDGGWAQTTDRDSDAFATGQVLYFLNVAGVKGDDERVKRGVAFLLSTQREDGSWPMKPRGHPGEKGANNIWPVTHLGSAWATLGLIRHVPR